MKKNSKKLLLLLPASFIFAPLSLISCSSNQKTNDNVVEDKDKLIESAIKNFQNIVVDNVGKIKDELSKIRSTINNNLSKIGYKIASFEDDYNVGNEQLSGNINVKIIVVNNKDEKETKTYNISIKFNVINNKVYDIQLSEIHNKQWKDHDAFIDVDIEIQPDITKLVQNAPNANYYVWSYENEVIQEGSNFNLLLGKYIDQLGDVTFELQAFEDNTKKNLLGFGSRTYKMTPENIKDDLYHTINGGLFAEFEASLTKPDKGIEFVGDDFTNEQLKEKIKEKINQIFEYITIDKYKDYFQLVLIGEPIISNETFPTESQIVWYKEVSIKFEINFVKYPKITTLNKKYSIEKFKVRLKKDITIETPFASYFQETLTSQLNESLGKYEITPEELITKTDNDSTSTNSWKYYVDWDNNMIKVADFFGDDWKFVKLSEPSLINKVHDVPEQDGEQAYKYVVIKLDFDYKGNPNSDTGYTNPESVKNMEIILKFVV